MTQYERNKIKTLIKTYEEKIERLDITRPFQCSDLYMPINFDENKNKFMIGIYQGIIKDLKKLIMKKTKKRLKRLRNYHGTRITK